MDLTTAKKLLKNTQKNELIKIIARLSTYDEAANEWLLDYCKEHCEEDNKLVVQKQMQHYWRVAEKIIDEANDYGGCSEEDEDEAYDALRKIDKLNEENETPWEFRKAIVDGMMGQFFLGNSGFEDTLYDSCSELCKTQEEQLYLADVLSKSRSTYYRRIAATIHLNCGNEEAFLEIRSQNLEYGSDYIALADYYRSHGQQDKAVALVEQALSKADGRMDDVYRWLFDEYCKNGQEDKIQSLYRKALSRKWDADVMVELMLDFYSDDYDRKREYLLKMPELCDSRDTKKWFDRCRSELSEEDFNIHKRHLYVILQKRNMHDYLQQKIDDGELQEVWDYLKSYQPRLNGFGVDEGHNLTKQLADAYPQEICEQYWKECEILCSQSNKKNYSKAVHILVEIKKICKKHKMTEAWKSRYYAFLEKHKRKPLLMGYIQSEKALPS